MPPDDRGRHPSAAGAVDLEALPLPHLDHLRRLTDHLGLWEHARLTTPRVEHGFCTDDNARALVVVSRLAPSLGDVDALATVYLRFLLDARDDSGHFRNRRQSDGRWLDAVAGTDEDDTQGRVWWALGTVARLGHVEWMRREAANAFPEAISFHSSHLRANAYAALGAAEMLAAAPGNPIAIDLLERSSAIVAGAARRAVPWPEDRLSYDNARLPEALLAAGTALGDGKLIATGLRLLDWLLRVETREAHFSFTPHTGWSPGQDRPGYDQQPLEAWAMADACFRAWSTTGDSSWRHDALRAARWLVGCNDTGMTLYDPATGATGDGLMEHSVNANCGAESTLSGIGALQVGSWCVDDHRSPATV